MADITRYDTESKYPNQIDDLLCLNDVDLEHLPISNQHRNLLAEKRYTDAGELLENSDMDSLCASLFNLIENRIYSTQEYINNKHTMWYEEYGVESPIECFDMPKDTVKKPVWTNIEDLSKIDIPSLGGGYTLSVNGGFRP
jgi:hypothetical protein